MKKERRPQKLKRTGTRNFFLCFVFLLGPLDQFRYIKIQSQTIDLRARLWGINPTNSVFIPQSLVLSSIV